MARFAGIIWGFPNWTPFLWIVLRGLKNCESQVWGDSRESLERHENIFFLQIDSRESHRFALRIVGPSKLNNHCSYRTGSFWTNLETILLPMVMAKPERLQSGASQGDGPKSDKGQSEWKLCRFSRATLTSVYKTRWRTEKHPTSK